MSEKGRMGGDRGEVSACVREGGGGDEGEGEVWGKKGEGGGGMSRPMKSRPGPGWGILRVLCVGGGDVGTMPFDLSARGGPGNW
jgi:hypothetical protein